MPTSQDQYRHALRLVDDYVKISTPSTEELTPEELTYHSHKVWSAAIRALDVLLYTDLYEELRQRAGNPN